MPALFNISFQDEPLFYKGERPAIGAERKQIKGVNSLQQLLVAL